jgi:hypothetical protein
MSLESIAAWLLGHGIECGIVANAVHAYYWIGRDNQWVRDLTIVVTFRDARDLAGY